MARKEATNYGHMIKLVNQYDAAKGYLDACNHNATNTGGLASRPRQTRTSSGTWQYNAQGLVRNSVTPRRWPAFAPACKCRHLPHLFASMPDVAQAPLPATMRAVVWRGDHDPGQMRIEVLRMPEPKANEVLIKVRACGGYVRTWPVWQASAAEPADWPRPTEAPRADLSNLRWEKPAESPLAEGRAALFSTQVRCVPHRPPLHQGRGTLPAARGLRPRDLRRGGPLRPAGGGG